MAEITVINEALHPCDGIVSERHMLSRDEAIVAQNQTIVVGQVLSYTVPASDESLTVTAKAGNNGDGTVTPDPTTPIGGTAIDGEYQVEFLSGGATSLYNVIDPNGALVGVGNVGTPFAGPINFTIADDPAHHYIAGDVLYFQVLIPTGEAVKQWAAWNPNASDGSEIPRAIALDPAVTGAGQTLKIALLSRLAEFHLARVSWGSATAEQINEATISLAKQGLILR